MIKEINWTVREDLDWKQNISFCNVIYALKHLLGLMGLLAHMHMLENGGHWVDACN